MWVKYDYDILEKTDTIEIKVSTKEKDIIFCSERWAVKINVVSRKISPDLRSNKITDKSIT